MNGYLCYCCCCCPQIYTSLMILDSVNAGEPGEGKRAVWIVARQHPGESMAEWFMEGMLHALLDPYHGLSKELLNKAVFYIVRLAVTAPTFAVPLSSVVKLRDSAESYVFGSWHHDRSPLHCTMCMHHGPCRAFPGMQAEFPPDTRRAQICLLSRCRT